ncbi:hypothetical protein PanWU01x14_021750 [Parasponia andersonii]|uniref:Transmembrane protein n=1 Tax=Parasponia andersonii TaxID=3476 RepID=A0A2P5DY44_PARAD|nr:hypothetical protein PanWU01x14_021750 [Parasponia andersonii]
MERAGCVSSFFQFPSITPLPAPNFFSSYYLIASLAWLGLASLGVITVIRINFGIRASIKKILGMAPNTRVELVQDEMKEFRCHREKSGIAPPPPHPAATAQPDAGRRLPT